MRGGFDLYGNYYSNANDAMNAEMSQCNEIDNRINQRKLDSLERQLSEQQRDEDTFRELWHTIERLENRIKELENKLVKDLINKNNDMAKKN